MDSEVRNCPREQLSAAGFLHFCMGGQVMGFQSRSSANGGTEGVFLVNVLQVNTCTSLVFFRIVHIAVAKQQMICFDAGTQKYYLFVFLKTVFTTGAIRVKNFHCAI